MVALIIITIVWAAMSSILFRNYSRVIGGDSTDELIELAYMKLAERVEEGYPQELISPTDWEPFYSIEDENKIIRPSYRWRYMVEDYEDFDWAEGSDHDDELRYDDEIVDPYRLIIVEIQEFMQTDAYSEGEPLGVPLKLWRIMKPVKNNSQAPPAANP